MRAWLKVLVWVAVGIGAALLVLRQFFVAWRVPADDPLLSASIEPTLSAGDLVVVVRSASVARGSLLRCADPDAPGRFVVGRAIGRSGDLVELGSEVVSLDGHRTPSPRACDAPTMTVYDPRTGEDVDLSCSIEEYNDRSFCALRAMQQQEPPTKVTVEPGLWFLVSDNRHVHLDSRDYGQVDPNTCQPIVFRLVSAAGFGDSKHRLSIIW
jgi:signal peptidase I